MNGVVVVLFMLKKLLMQKTGEINVENTGVNATFFKVGVGDNVNIANKVKTGEMDLIIEGGKVGSRLEITSTGKNMFNGKWLLDISVNPLTGNLMESSMATMDFIKVRPNTAYIFYNSMSVFEYDKNYKLIKNTGTIPNGSSFTTSSNTSYIRAYRGQSLLSEAQLEEGRIKTEYERYKNNKIAITLKNTTQNITIDVFKGGHVLITGDSNITKTIQKIKI